MSGSAKAGPQAQYSRYLLVAPGKYGADGLVAGFEGKPVRLQGQLIYREGETMVEVVPGSIKLAGAAPASQSLPAQEATRDLGAVTLTGEIVDSKCYLGGMNPGKGKVHRDCAARCLSGAIPPVFVANNVASGVSSGGPNGMTNGAAIAEGDQLLLVGLDGLALEHDALREFIAEPITIQGKLLARGESRLLLIDPHSLHHAAVTIEAAR